MPSSPPEPLRVLVGALDSETQALRAVWRLIDCFEWAIKWCTAITMAELLRSQQISETMRAEIAEGLSTPSLGLWMHFHRRALSEPGCPEAWRRWDLALRLNEDHGIVRFRNSYGHGALRSDEECWADVERMRPILDQLLTSPFFTEVELVPPDDDAEDSVQSAWVRVPALSDPLLDLSPIALWLKRADRWRWYYFNALRKPKVETLNYDLPDTQRQKEIWEGFHERLPLDEWRRLPADQAFLDEVRALTASFKGRQDERTALADFITGGGTLFLLGAPGIGKSALVAMAVVDARREMEGEEAPVIVDYFIRRGEITATPAYFLKSLVERIERAQSLRRSAKPSTEADWYDRLLELMHLVREDHGRRRMVLLVDGLDESPELLQYLVPGDERVSLVCSSRPTQEIKALIGETWATRGARTLTMGPLQPSDVRALLYDVANKYDDRFTNEYVEALAATSEGNPLFLYLYLQQLADEPDLLGSIERIPRGIGPLLEEAIKRATAGDDEVALDLIYLLSVSHEALSARDIALVLGVRERFISARIDQCREILVEAGDSPVTFQLFHEVVREYLTQSVGGSMDVSDDARRAHGQLARAALATEATANDYLCRWGPRHALDSRDAELVAEHSLALGDLDRMSARLTRLDPETLLRQHVEIYAAAPADALSGLVQSLAALIVEDSLRGDASLTPEVVHGILGYHPDVRLYDAVLPYLVVAAEDEDSGLASAARAGLLHCAGTRSRRKGGAANFVEARAFLARGLALCEEDPDAPMLSRLHYDLGYVAMLQGEVEQAREGFRMSAEVARSQGSPVAAAIADCVLAVFESRIGATSPEDCTELLSGTLGVFEDLAEVSVNAERWVSNVRVHLLDEFCAIGAEPEARLQLARLTDDPWVRRFSSDAERASWVAWVDLAFGDPAAAIEPFARRAEPDVALDVPIEQRARWFLALGDALARAGRPEEAQEAWSMGLACPADAGNWMWRPELQERLAAN